MFIMVMKEIEILCFLCFAQPFENLTKLLWKFDNMPSHWNNHNVCGVLEGDGISMLVDVSVVDCVWGNEKE